MRWSHPALSVGDLAESDPTLSSGLAYLPVELMLAGLALAVYGLRPRLFGIVWAGYAVMTFIAFLGPGLNFDQWVLDLSPTTNVGNPPAGAGPSRLAPCQVMPGSRRPASIDRSRPLFRTPRWTRLRSMHVEL